MENHGRNRQSINDIREVTDRLLSEHPAAEYDDNGVASIPLDRLPDFLSAFYDETGHQFMDEESLNNLREFKAQYPDIPVNATLLVDLIAQMTKPSEQLQEDEYSEEDSDDRGRLFDREDGSSSDRSSSIGSINTTTHPHSRPPSVGPGDTPRNHSVFDTGRRQRSTPLGSYVAPTSWKPRPPHARRRSDASNRSDSEPYSDSPSAFKRSTSRQSRRRSNPVSPSTSDMDSSFSIGSPPFQRSRPPSRSHSRAASFNNSGTFSNSRGSPEESPDDSADHFFANSVNSLPMPTHDSDSESEDGEEETAMGRILPRSTASSTVSMEQSERLEALERHERELTRRLQESERTYQGKMATYEDEIAMLETRIEELKDEVNQHLRDEKDLRSKERQNMTQIGALETEIAKVTKSLEHSRATYSNLQKQYQEQCAASEKYRDDIRLKDITIRSLREQVSQYENETSKWGKEAQLYEERVGKLESDLEESLQVHATLDEQKQENMLLKETIDRMRFDLDEMRNSASNTANAGPTNSAKNTISKSFGAELAKMQGSWNMDEHEDVEEGDSLGGTEVPDDDSDDEDVIQTIITRKKRRTGVAAIKSIETKEVCDQGTQYDLEFKDVDASVASIQTEPEPRIMTSFADIQTDPIPEPEPEPVRTMVEMEVQTIEPEPVEEAKPEPEPSLPVASSSKTLIGGDDLPPAYSLTQEQIREDMVKHYHPGVELPLHTESSLTAEQKDQWKALKKSLGVDCLVVDNLVDQAPTTPRPAPPQPKRGGKFQNIYNTYIYRNSAASVVTHTAMVVGLSVLVMSVVGPHLVPHYSVPGGPTYYDRAAWSSFNSMHAAGEGFAMGADGTAAVWGLLGRVGDGAARIARGWPT